MEVLAISCPPPFNDLKKLKRTIVSPMEPAVRPNQACYPSTRVLLPLVGSTTSMSKMPLLSQNSPLAAEICIEEEEKRAQLV